MERKSQVQQLWPLFLTSFFPYHHCSTSAVESGPVISFLLLKQLYIYILNWTRCQDFKMCSLCIQMMISNLLKKLGNLAMLGLHFLMSTRSQSWVMARSYGWGLCSFHFLQPLYPLLFRSDAFYCSVFKFTGPIFCSIHSSVKSIQWKFSFQILYFSIH